MKTSNIILIGILVVFYSFLLGIFGFFGEFISQILIFFVKNILPYICILLGYFLCIFIPIRINQALQRNKKIQEEISKNEKLEKYSKEQKASAEKIRTILSDKDIL